MGIYFGKMVFQRLAESMPRSFKAVLVVAQHLSKTLCIVLFLSFLPSFMFQLVHSPCLCLALILQMRVLKQTIGNELWTGWAHSE